MLARVLACLLLAALAPAAASLEKPAGAPTAIGKVDADLDLEADTAGPKHQGHLHLLQLQGQKRSASGWSFVLPIRRQVVANGKRQPGFVLELVHPSGQSIIFGCIAEDAGQIVSFELNGDNILLDHALGPSEVWGSTFWPSPQSAWGWPPPPAFLTAVYDAEVDEQAMSVTLTGPISEKLGVRCVKRFMADLATGTVKVEYTMETARGTKQRLAPWEITRLNPEGLLVWETSTSPSDVRKAANIVTDFPPLPIHHVGGASVYNLASEAGEGKTEAPSGGDWFAYARPGVLFIKRFHKLPPGEPAPGERQLEVYSFGAKGKPSEYTEMELQGAYMDLSSESPYPWTVEWILKPLPGNISSSRHSQELLDFIRAQL